jgi:hypothetical protein
MTGFGLTDKFSEFYCNPNFIGIGVLLPLTIHSFQVRYVSKYVCYVITQIHCGRQQNDGS